MMHPNEKRTTKKIYGIDLGTTNSCISVLKEGRPYIIPVDESGIVPSVISFDGKELLVGRKAWNRAAAFPEQSVRSVKRLMGTSETLKLDKKTYEPEDISAMILRYLCDEARRLEGHDVEHVVITVPAYFSDAQRRATIEAGRRAGLTVERIINEPTAAALFYDHVQIASESAKEEAPWRHALVYDLGGGTFDVSVLRMGEIIEVLANTGDTYLGGDDFDNRLLVRLMRQIEKTDGLDLKDHVPALARLTAVAEKVKIGLSEKAVVRVEESYIPTPKGKNGVVSMEFTREAFEEMTEDLVDRTLACVEKALEEAKLSPEDIDRVLLVGGMTRMPVIAARLEEIFGEASLPVVDPDRSVGNGAAIQGGIISGENCSQILVDATPHTLSLESLASQDDHTLICVPIIPRNTQIPVTRSRTFATMQDKQDMVLLRVFQGESQIPQENTLIGETSLKLAPSQANCPVIVEYSYDLNGMVRLVAEQKGFSRKTELRLDSRNPQLFEEQPLQGLGEDEEGEMADAETLALNFVVQRARTLIERMPTGEGRDILQAQLVRYQEALRTDAEDIDEIEDDLLALMEKI